MDQEKIRSLADLLSQSHRAVFFGGAGVSTESGIPDFRSTDGLYHQQWDDPPETILSHTYFQRRTEDFFRFYRQKMLFPLASPNAAHRALAQLEDMGILAAVITQNIDGLHQAAGSKRVIELHGSVLRNHCMQCGEAYTMQDVLHSKGIPRCACGGVIKPDVVLYEESLPFDAIEQAVSFIAQADLMIIGGTSLAVYPAASFAADYRGKLVIINRSPTPMDHRADLLIDQPIGETFKAVMPLVTARKQ